MKKILIVEDEKGIADIVVRFFERRNFDVDVAYNLSQGMKKSDSEYDLVLLDIALGKENSFPLLKKIKKERPQVPVLIFSGYDTEENIREAKRLGADGFIPKSFKIEFLDQFLLPKVESLRKSKAGRKKKK